MSKISKAFSGQKALIGYLTAGDPSPADTVSFCLAMEQAGVNLIEIGLPFSDPAAEGPVIQAANRRALEAGTTTEQVFAIVSEIRKHSQIPLVILTYLNPVFCYGYSPFFSRCAELGIDGIIIPDLPLEERDELAEPAAQNGIDIIALVAPTSGDRIRQIVHDATGFVYVVSSMGVTGMRSSLPPELQDTLKQVRAFTDLPIAVGFGINTTQQVNQLAPACDGIIVGSALVRQIEIHREQAAAPLRQVIGDLRKALDQV